MKRTYCKPQCYIVKVSGIGMIALSETMRVGGTTSSSEDIGFVKGESSRGSHSVWDDDWSKE